MSIPYKKKYLFEGSLDGVLHVPSQTFIPNDPRNKDWQDFLAWKRATGLDALPRFENEKEKSSHYYSHLTTDRNARINEVLWMVERHRQQKEGGLPTTLTSGQYLELLHYIQALRDVPQNNPDLTFITWPSKPAFLNQ